ncbi:hypothetical protein O181_018759 [Austropuccinia psidii MF-1]|uniref:Uncharacterized protein n=1 Tax=Austropuccinia psidii MF-1 TaxID=1389203 RepID=A0A9Q3C8A4_9BASI|nr:hypothetical protein [Austropuccinia psidii MF-1]
MINQVRSGPQTYRIARCFFWVKWFDYALILPSFAFTVSAWEERFISKATGQSINSGQLAPTSLSNTTPTQSTTIIMTSSFAPHDPTGHLRRHNSCCGSSHSMPSLPEPTPLDELIKIYNLSVDPETSKVSLAPNDKSFKNQKSSEDQKVFEDTLNVINELSSQLARAPFPHCPPPPQLVPNNLRSQQITSLKEQGNTAFKALNFDQAVEFYSLAADAAATRPLFEPSGLTREELSIMLCNRSAAYSSMKLFNEAVVDAESVIKLKRNWSKGHFRRAKALQGLGRIDDARDAALVGLEFEPDNLDLKAVYDELSNINTKVERKTLTGLLN